MSITVFHIFVYSFISLFFFFSSRRRHTRYWRDWSSDVCSSDLGAPVARPSAVICIGMNYAAHAAESGAAPPERPVLFLKTPNTVGGPDDPVQIPRDRKSGAEGKRLDLGGRRIIKKYISNILSRT